jgi:hypothetical protein
VIDPFERPGEDRQKLSFVGACAASWNGIIAEPKYRFGNNKNQ